MSSVLDDLRKDHDVLRMKLGWLEEILTSVQPPETLRRACHSLTRILDAHVRKEERALAPYASRVQAVLTHHAPHDCAAAQVVLHDLDVLLSEGQRVPAGTLAMHLCRLIDELRERLAEEEHNVFPIVEFAQGSVSGQRDFLHKAW